MADNYDPCQQCGEPVEFKANILCFDCAILRRRERSYVPLHGDGPRLSGKTGTCVDHGRRGCVVCFPDCAEALR